MQSFVYTETREKNTQVGEPQESTRANFYKSVRNKRNRMKSEICNSATITALNY